MELGIIFKTLDFIEEWYRFGQTIISYYKGTVISAVGI